MTQTRFSTSVEIAAPPQVVWSVMEAIERWPEWTPSVKRIVRLTPGALGVGSRVRIHQPKLPPAFWRVTELEPGSHFTWVSVWVSRGPGIRVTAQHVIQATPTGSRVTLTIRYEGLFGPLLARFTRDINDRYLSLEASGLKARCESERCNRDSGRNTL
jgi:uncharacterized membrane protein